METDQAEKSKVTCTFISICESMKQNSEYWRDQYLNYLKMGK